MVAVALFTIELRTHVCWSLHATRLARKNRQVFRRSNSLCTRVEASRQRHNKSSRRRAEHRAYALESFKWVRSPAIEHLPVASAVDERHAARSAEKIGKEAVSCPFTERTSSHATTPGGSNDTGSSTTSFHSVSWSMGDTEGGTVRRNTLSTPAPFTWFLAYKSRPKISANFPAYDWLARLGVGE